MKPQKDQVAQEQSSAPELLQAVDASEAKQLCSGAGIPKDSN